MYIIMQNGTDRATLKNKKIKKCASIPLGAFPNNQKKSQNGKFWQNGTDMSISVKCMTLPNSNERFATIVHGAY